VIAPRHPERFGVVASLLERSGREWAKRSAWHGEAGEGPRLAAGQIVLLDTIGELASVYSLAAVAFVGGSLAPGGGHNPLEPAQFGVPVVMGPNYENFRVIVEELRAQDGLRIVEKEQLGPTLIELLSDETQAREMGSRARHVFERQAGATQRCVDAIKEAFAHAPAVGRAV